MLKWTRDNLTKALKDQAICRCGEVHLPQWVTVKVEDGDYPTQCSDLFRIGPLCCEYHAKLVCIKGKEEAVYEIT